jgi:YidC/Oxa1 family membrane protein insertase
MDNLFISIIYQPFLNILVFFYWMLGIVTRGHPDMGVAVILLTIVIRIILLPLSLSEERSADERRALVKKFHELEANLAADPVALKAERKKLFHRNPKFVIGETISLIVQVIIALMLWKMFETGLPGEDVHLIYKFMPHVETPFNLVFLGKYDLTHTNVALNIMQSLMIFLVETVSILTSPYPPMKGEVVRMQLVLPVVSFLVFMRLPAGKKIFVIMTLLISLLILIYKFIKHKWQDYMAKMDEKAKAAEAAMAEATSLAGGPPPGGVPVPLPGATPVAH